MFAFPVAHHCRRTVLCAYGHDRNDNLHHVHGCALVYGYSLEIVLRAAKNIVRGQVFDENFLMSVATIGAFAVGEYPEGVMVMLLYQLGELFQDYAVHRSNHCRCIIAGKARDKIFRFCFLAACILHQIQNFCNSRVLIFFFYPMAYW